MAISLLSSTPSQGATDVQINKSIELVFNKTIASSSITENVFSLIDIDSGQAFPLTVSPRFDTSSRIILLPSQSLKENTQYRIIVIGTDSGLGYSLVANDADTLTTTIYIEFSTGEGVYKVDSVLEKEAASLSLEGDLFLPTNVKALGYDFTITKVRPKNNKHGLAQTLTGDNTIKFTFSKNLYTGDSDVSDWVDVNLFPLLNTASYLASGQEMGSFPIPGYAVTTTGKDLVVTFASELPKNLGIHIELKDTILSEDNEPYGGKMIYSVNTALFPEIYGIETIKREVKDIADTYNEDYIGALLFKNTIWTWERVGRVFMIDNIPYPARQYIVYSTILDLMEDAEYSKYLIAGTRRQLGDLGVSVDNFIGKIAMKVAKYQRLKEVALDSILKGWQFRIGVTTMGYLETAQMVNRLWYDVNGRYTDIRFSYHQNDVPAANSLLNRRARETNPLTRVVGINRAPFW